MVEGPVGESTEPADEGWVTVGEAARRLGMSVSWFKEWADGEGIEVRRRGRGPGVNWSSVEAAVARSRIIRVGRSGVSERRG